MDVYLIRHAVAHERSRARWPDDSLRPLTAHGRRKFRKAARGLRELMPRSVRLITSPFVRARDTALLLADVAGLAKPIERAELSAGQPVEHWFSLLRERGNPCIALVGHEPALGEFLAEAVARSGAKLTLEFKKGGAACLSFDRRVAPGGATLKWMLPPRLLQAIRA